MKVLKLHATMIDSHEKATPPTKRHLKTLLPKFTKINDKRNSNASVSSLSNTKTTISPLCNNSNSTCLLSHQPVAIPKYSTLKKLFLKFESKPKCRRDILKVDVSPWFRTNSNDICFQESPHHPKESASSSFFGGLKDVSKQKKKLEYGRSVLLKWWRSLLNNISVASQDEKILYFEIIFEIMARNEFLEYDFVGPFHYNEWLHQSQEQPISDYRCLLVASLRLAIDKLNQKAIFSNFILFSAKVLALSYFKVPGVAILLLQVLDTPLKCMESLQKEMTPPSQEDQQQQQQQFVPNIQSIFPSFLHKTIITDQKSYQDCLASNGDTSEMPLDKSGNWKRRWDSDDSELFFSFYRHYHATLSTYIKARYPNMSQLRLHQRNLILTVSPGYVCLASYFASKLHLLTQREICSVTNGGTGTNNSKNFMSSTLSSMNSIQSINENGDCKTSFNSVVGKPEPLVAATKRYSECMTWNTIVADSDGLYHDMVNVWLRTVIKKTVLTNAEQVFCLLDLLEQTMLDLQKYPVKLAYFPIDRPFILYTLNIVLSRCDHTITLLRALSFIYAHFHFLTADAALLDMLCNRILMNTFILERLLLHWGRNVRIFFLRCLVWRVGRVWHTEDVMWSTEISKVIKENDIGGKHNICNGHQCWLRWSSNSCNHVADKQEETQVDNQCALEIHIKLETLMASFHKNYFSIQDKRKGQPLDATVPETPMTGFTSNLVLLAPMSHATTTQHCPLSTSSNLENSGSLHHQQRSSSFKLLALNRKSLTIRFDKREFLKLFNSTNGSLVHRFVKGEPTYLENCEADEGICTTDTVHKEEANASREIYTVENEYSSVNSSSFPPPLQESPLNAQEEQDTSQSAFLSSIIHSWRYEHTKQAYAKKAIAELREVVGEYHAWLQKSPGTSVEVALMAPKLILEWPRNWTFSI